MSLNLPFLMIIEENLKYTLVLPAYSVPLWSDPELARAIYQDHNSATSASIRQPLSSS